MVLLATRPAALESADPLPFGDFAGLEVGERVGRALHRYLLAIRVDTTRGGRIDACERAAPLATSSPTTVKTAKPVAAVCRLRAIRGDASVSPSDNASAGADLPRSAVGVECAAVVALAALTRKGLLAPELAAAESACRTIAIREAFGALGVLTVAIADGNRRCARDTLGAMDETVAAFDEATGLPVRLWNRHRIDAARAVSAALLGNHRAVATKERQLDAKTKGKRERRAHMIRAPAKTLHS